MAAMSAESEGATTDDDVHLSPSSVCSSASGGSGGRGGGGRGGGAAAAGGGVRFKILCSFGGRIMPRPSDGALKYIGGETRVLAVHRSIPFADLKKKVEEMFRTEVAAIKYQLLSEDLDVLVSVTCDEDLVHMLDEYDRFEAKRSPSASPRFRVYVFVSSPPQQQHAFVSPAAAGVSSSSSRHASYARSQQQYHQLQQQHHRHGHHFQPDRYVATVPSTPNGSPPYPDQPNGVVSAGNSPRAPNIVAEQQPVFRAGGMQRVRSSPNLGGLNGTLQQFNQHAGEDGGLSGYMSGSPVHAAAASPLFSQGNNYSSHYRHPQQQYTPALVPVPVPVPLHGGGAGRYEAPRGYVRGGSSYMAAPMVPALRSGRPVTRAGAATYGEMQTPKKTATIWD